MLFVSGFCFFVIDNLSGRSIPAGRPERIAAPSDVKLNDTCLEYVLPQKKVSKGEGGWAGDQKGSPLCTNLGKDKFFRRMHIFVRIFGSPQYDPLVAVVGTRRGHPRHDAHRPHLPSGLQHSNLYGRYEFTKASEPINMEEIVEALAHDPILSMWTKEMPKYSR